jgi:hypothetical protein
MMQTRIRISLLAFVILVLVGLPVTAHYRAKSRLSTFKAHLKASGEKLSVEELRPPLSPQELRTGAELMAIAARLGSPSSNAPTMRFVVPGRALAACLQEVLPMESSTNIWPGLATMTEQNEDALAELRAVLVGPGFGFDLDYRRAGNLPLTHLARMKGLAQWLAVATTLELHAREITNAWEDLNALVNLVAGYQKDALIISELVRVAMTQIAINPTWEALQCAGRHEPQLELVQTRWESVDLLAQAESALAMERLFGEASFQAGRESFSAVNVSPIGSGTVLSELAQIGKEIVDDPAQGLKTALHRYPGYWGWKYWQSYEDEIVNGQALQAGIDAVRHARRAGIVGLAVSDFEKDAARLRRASPSAGKWVGYSAFDTLDRFLVRIRTIEIQRSLLIAAIALSRYELKHGCYPADLADLTPELLRKVPRDPIDGQPLRYRTRPDHTFVLYSVGENGADDGGNPEPLREAPKQWWRARDAVWPWPATREQVETELRAAREQYAKQANATNAMPPALMEQFRRRYGLAIPSNSTNTAATR